MSAVPLGSLRGVPLRVHWSFLLLPLFLLWWTGSKVGFGEAVAELGVLTALFACVVLHELGHALVARRWGVATESITLYPFGGVARLDRPPPTGRAEAAIAAAGPAVNLALAGAAALAMAAAGLIGGSATAALRVLVWVNLGIGAFNLMPGFPLDGGRALRGLLSTRLGDVRATVWAASIGQILAVVLTGVGVIHEPWLALGGVLLLPAANSELRAALRRRATAAEGVGAVMSARPTRISPEARLDDLLELSRRHPPRDFLVDDDGRLGWLPATRVWRSSAPDHVAGRTAGEMATPIGHRVREEQSAVDVLAELEASGAAVAAVEDARGRVVGVISTDRLRVALRLRHALGPDRPDPSDEPE